MQGGSIYPKPGGSITRNRASGGVRCPTQLSTAEITRPKPLRKYWAFLELICRPKPPQSTSVGQKRAHGIRTLSPIYVTENRTYPCSIRRPAGAISIKRTLSSVDHPKWWEWHVSRAPRVLDAGDIGEGYELAHTSPMSTGTGTDAAQAPEIPGHAMNSEMLIGEFALPLGHDGGSDAVA
jgi:hypothetical protein